jgi:hypothetical protein
VAIGDIGGDPVDEHPPVLAARRGPDPDPSGTPVQAEHPHLRLGRPAPDHGRPQRGHPILVVRVHVLAHAGSQVGPGRQLPAEDAAAVRVGVDRAGAAVGQDLEGPHEVVDLRDRAVEVAPGGGQGQRQVLGAAAFEVAAEVRADAVQHGQQIVVRLVGGDAEEQQHAEGLLVAAYGQADRGVQAGVAEELPPGDRTRVAGHLGDPQLGVGVPDDPGQALATGERDRPVPGERTEIVAGPGPRADPGDRPGGVIGLPELAVRPVQRGRDGGDGAGGGLLGAGRVGQRLGDGVLGVAQHLGAMLIGHLVQGRDRAERAPLGRGDRPTVRHEPAPPPVGRPYGHVLALDPLPRQRPGQRRLLRGEQGVAVRAEQPPEAGDLVDHRARLQLVELPQRAVADSEHAVRVARGHAGVQAVEQGLQERPLVLQLALGPHPGGDVVQKCLERRRAVFLGHLQCHLDRELGPAAVDGVELEALTGQLRPAAAAYAFEPGLVRGAEPLRDDQLGDRPADGLRRGIAEEACGGRVPAGDQAVRGGRDERVLGGVEHRPHPLRAQQQLTVRHPQRDLGLGRGRQRLDQR